MSLNQIIDKDPNGPLVCDDTLSLFGYQLRLKKELDVPEGNFDNVNTITINGAPYPPAGLLPSPLIANKVLRTNSAATAVLWGDVPHGTANQVFHTNSAGTGSEWTTNLTIPGSFTSEGNGIFEVDLAVQNELNVTEDLAVINGNVNIGLGNLNVITGLTTVVDENVTGDLQFNGVSGTANQVLTKLTPTTQGWVDITPGSIPPGASNQVFVTNAPATSAGWSDDLDLPGLFNVSGGATCQSTLIVGGDVTHIATSTFNGLMTTNNGSTLQGITNIVNDLRFNGSGGTTGQYVKKTGAATQAFSSIVAGDITSGSANQVFVTNLIGSTSQWSNSLTLPGTLTVTSTSTMNGVTNLAGDLRFNNLAGSSGQFVKKTGAATQAFSDIIITDIKGGSSGQIALSNGTNATWSNLPQYFVQYYQNAPLQDMNGAATVLLMSSASPIATNSGITYSAGVFTLVSAGTYIATFQTKASTSGFRTQVNFRVNGAFTISTTNTYIPSLAQAQPLTLTDTFTVSANSTFEVVSQPLVAGVVNTSGSDSNGNSTTRITITRIS